VTVFSLTKNRTKIENEEIGADLIRNNVYYIDKNGRKAKKKRYYRTYPQAGVLYFVGQEIINLKSRLHRKFIGKITPCVYLRNVSCNPKCDTLKKYNI
jgi:hypothetical protein